MQKFVIKQFKPEDTDRHRTWLIIGARNTGKSCLLKDLLYKTQKGKCDLCLAMTATITTSDMFKEFLPPNFVYDNGFDAGVCDNYLQTCRETIENRKQRSTTLVLDDLAFDAKFLKSSTPKQLFLNGRHFNTSTFLTTQYSMAIPVIIRANIDFVIALKETILINRKRLYDHYFGAFKSFKDFEKVFNFCTKNYGCLVLDRTAHSGELQDLIKHYKADINLPPFKIGKSVFFKLDKVCDEARKKKRCTTDVIVS